MERDGTGRNGDICRAAGARGFESSFARTLHGALGDVLHAHADPELQVRGIVPLRTAACRSVPRRTDPRELLSSSFSTPAARALQVRYVKHALNKPLGVLEEELVLRPNNNDLSVGNGV